MVLLIGLAACLSTLLGGSFAIRFKDRLHLILGFSAGAVIAVAFFDLMPEALNLSAGYYSSLMVTTTVCLGFLVYMILDRFVTLHSHAEEEHDHSHDGHAHSLISKQGTPRRGILGAGSLSIHSFLDGVAIGLAFQVGAAVGTVVALAVLAHDFSDGINTVNVILKNHGKKNEAMQWLLTDAIAPIIGVASTLFFSLPQNALAIILAIFCGFFLYIGASDLLPESHHAHPTVWTTIMTLLGAGLLFAIIHTANL